MAAIRKVNTATHALDITSNWAMSVREVKPGPPERIDGMTVGFVQMSSDAPHNGELHPDGDEFLYVISGRVRVTCDSDQEATELGPGEACIVPAGEWHKVGMVEPTQLIHITPGPRGDHRPLE